MVEFFLEVFIIISIVFVIVLIFQGQNYKQFHWLFIMFMVMYNTFPALNYLDIKPKFVRINMDLTHNTDLIELQLIISSLSIIAYLILLLFYKNKFVINLSVVNNRFRVNLKYLYILLYPITIYFVILFPWPEYGDAISFGNSLAAYFKNIELVLLIMVFVYYNKSKKIIYLISYIIIILIDSQRTPLLVAFIAYLLVSDNNKALLYTMTGVIGIVILSIIAVYRNGVDISPINMLYPFYNEGIFGSYCALQSLEIVQNYHYTIFTYLELFISPIYDIIIKLIPHFYFDLFNFNKQDFYILGSFIDENVKQGILTERWTPMGGFFYIAESNLMIPYIGPILFTVGLFFVIKKVINLKNTVLKILLYSNLFLYIKASMFIATKYIIFLLISYYAIVFIDKLFRVFLDSYNRRLRIDYIN